MPARLPSAREHSLDTPEAGVRVEVVDGPSDEPRGWRQPLDGRDIPKPVDQLEDVPALGSGALAESRGEVLDPPLAFELDQRVIVGLG